MRVAANRRTRRLGQAAAVIAVAAVGCGEPPAPAPANKPSPTAANVVETPPPSPVAGRVDDPRLLWASPTSGPPIDLGAVADGAQLILHARPAALLASDEGRRVWRALKAAIGAAASADLQSAGEVVASVAPGELYGELATTVAVDPPPSDELPLLSREIELLLDASDADRHATLIFSPEFLLGSGGVLVGDTDAPLRRLLLASCEADWRAVSLSAHLDGERLYWELRVLGSPATPELRRAAAARDRIGGAEDELRAVITGREWSDHAGALVRRTPAMLAAVARTTRSGAAGRQAVLNGYLPSRAAHNLALSADVLVAELSAPPPRVEAAGEPSAAPATLDDRLRLAVSVSFEREPLESALSVLANTMGARIEIAGRDLQLEGVTRNQLLSLGVAETPAGEALVELLRLANPDPLAAGPDDPRQRLVYVVRDDRIVVTTRAAVAGRGEELPAVFRPR